jgi:hypothetical protein
MHFLKTFKSLIFLILLANTTFAQLISLSSENDAFIEGLENVLKEGKNSIAIAEFDAFKTHFTSDFSSDEKRKIIKLCQNMTGKRYQMPEFYKLLLLLNNTYDPLVFPAEKRINLIGALEKLAKNHPLNTVLPIFIQINDLINNRIIYTSNYNKLYALKGSFDFQYLEKKQDYFEPEKMEVVATENKGEDFGLFDDWNETEEVDPWDDPNLAMNPDKFYRLIPLPSISNFVIKFIDIDLVFVSKSDSIPLYKTSGAADIIQNVWVGEKGTFDWSNVLIPEAKASFEEYTFKLSSPNLTAEKVKFTYDKFFEEPLEGVFEFKAGNRAPSQLSNFPRFKSYENNAVFTNLESSLDYKGGFSLIGNRVYSSSLYHNVSTLYVNKGLKNSFKVEGRKIEFTDSLITSDFVSFSTLIDEDSIYHPAVRLDYNLYTKTLTLQKQLNGGFRNAMYSDTFHEMDIRSDAMKWDLQTGKMDFYIIAGKSEIPAFFESFNYYNPARLRELSNIVGFNPLIFLGNYVFRKRKNEFNLFEIQDKIAKTPKQIKNGVTVAMQMGFIDYEPHTDKYRLSRKGLHYFKASTGRGDYDDLVFASVSKGGKDNASIDRNSNALDISGTQEFKLSDSLGIRFLPKDQSLKMEGSKSFKFEGQIVVKNYRLTGDFEVDYEHFLVNLNRIDSITFTPIEIYNAGGRKEIGGHMLYGKKGILFLNSPDNKSGRKSLPQYPRLLIPDGALVKFNEASRKQFGYDENVFFKIDKIDHDSLNAKNLAYEGIFSSNGIIPPFRETLISMPDTSVGFIHTPKGPYELYKTTSIFKFTAPLEMTKKGLISKGTFQHLAAKLEAKDAHFGTNQLKLNGEKANIKETFLSANTYFPDVSINEYKAVWKPVEDSLIINSPEAYSFYNESTKLSGGLVVRNNGLFGNGLLERNDSEAKSKGLKFNKSGFLASESNFIIKADTKGAKPVLESQNVEINFNIDEQMVDISPKKQSFNDSISSSISFPNAAYKTTIDNAQWNIQRKTISMEGNVENSVFTSASPSQYGLAFKGASAVYDISANTLNVSGVPGINSVDAIIIPSNGKVAIRSEGKLEPFTNATVIADTLNKYHTLANANITINSKLSYSGNASYQFINVSSDTFNIKMGSFEFADISPDGTVLNSKKSGKLSTIAKAKVTESDSVFLSPKMLYIGNITMQAPFKNLNLRGQVTPTLNDYPVLGSNWINYTGSKSEEITINVDETLKDGGKSLYAGLHLKPSSSTEGLYPTFLSAKGYEDDYDIFLARGIFKRDEPHKRFTIYPADSSELGNKYELYDEKGIIKLEGKLNLTQASLSPHIETVGLGEIGLDSMEYRFNTMMKFNMPIPIPMLLKMGDNLVKTNLDIGNSDGAINIESEAFLSKMAQFIGKKVTEDYITKYYKGHIPLFQASPKFFSSIFFSDLNFKWNPVFNSLYSTEKLGISNIGETDINAKVPGYFEIIKNPRTGDEIYIFLEVSPDTWYYLGYKAGQLGIISSDFEFNKMLVNNEKTTKGIELINVDMSEAMAFRKRFLMTYLGVAEEAFAKPRTVAPSVPGKIEPIQIPTSAASSETQTAKPVVKPAAEEKFDGF